MRSKWLGPIKQVKISWISFISWVRMYKNIFRCFVVLLLKVKRFVNRESVRFFHLFILFSGCFFLSFFHFFFFSFFLSFFLFKKNQIKNKIVRTARNLELQSWTKGWRKIDEIKQNRFFFGMVYSWFLRFFTEKCQNLAFGWTAGFSLSNPSIPGILWKFTNFLRP